MSRLLESRAAVPMSNPSDIPSGRRFNGAGTSASKTKLWAHITPLRSWFNYFQLFFIPLVVCIGWLMIPLLWENSPTMTYYIFVFAFMLFYVIWIHATVLYFLHRFILPELHLALRIVALVTVSGLIAAYYYCMRAFWHVDKNPWMYPLPGWLSPITSSIVYLIYAGYLAVKNLRSNTFVDVDHFDDGMAWIHNAAAPPEPSEDGPPSRDGLSTNSAYSEFDTHHEEEYRSEDENDLPPGPIEFQAEGDIVDTNYAAPLLDDADERTYNKSRYESLPPAHPFTEFLSKDLSDPTHQSLEAYLNNYDALTPQDRKSPLKTAIMGMIFVVGIIGVLFVNIELRNLFWTDSKYWPVGVEAAYAAGYHFIAFFIKQAVVNFVLRLPRRRALKPIVRLGLDVLFFLYWRSLFFKVTDILPYGIMSAAGVVSELLLYPLRMTFPYFRLRRAFTRCFTRCIICRSVDYETPEQVKTGYRLHKRDLAQEYYFYNIAKLFSGVAMIVFPVLLRFNWNAQVWEFEMHHMSDTVFVHLLALYGIQLAVEGILGAAIKYLFFGKIFHVDADFLGDLLLTNASLRVTLIGFIGHFLMDVWVFSMKMTDHL